MPLGLAADLAGSRAAGQSAISPHQRFKDLIRGKFLRVFEVCRIEIRARHRYILTLRHRRFPQIKVVHECDLALLFPNPMAILGLRAPHDERTGRHSEHHNAH
jgi:hypothetical protein